MTKQDNQYSSYIDYRRNEFILLTNLTRLLDIAQELDMPEQVTQVRDVIATIEARSFSIAVVGEFKRGKSTFINALLGKELLPSDITPTSATLNRVVYGITPHVNVIFKDETGGPGAVQEIDIDRLADYVTKLTPEAEAVAATVHEAVVFYPTRYCENNVSIIDTPGLNDDASMTQVTMDVLPRVDAAVMVVMADSPFSQFEGDFLNNLLVRALGRVFFVVTAIDRIRRERDRERLLTQIATRIKAAISNKAEEQFGKDSEEYHLYLRRVGEPRVFGLSGYDALQAKETGDIALLDQSGFRSFEAALEKFLTEERGATMLKVIAERLVRSGEKIYHKITLQQGALQMQHQEFEQTYQDMLAKFDILHERIEQEATNLDMAMTRTQEQVYPYIYHFAPQMIQSAEHAIDSAEITTDDLQRASWDAVSSLSGNLFGKIRGRFSSTTPEQQETPSAPDEKQLPSAFERLSQDIARSVGQFAETASDMIQLQIQQNFLAEVERVRRFAADTQRLLDEGQKQFAPHPEQLTHTRSLQTEGFVAALAVIAELGQLEPGYYDVGLKSAAMGSLAGAQHILTSGWQNVRALLSRDQSARQQQSGASSDWVNIFKANYKQQIATVVNQQITERQIDAVINQQIVDTFERLKVRMREEANTALDKHRAMVDELRTKRERSMALNERDRAGLEKMSQEVQQILQQAYELSDQLAVVLERA